MNSTELATMAAEYLAAAFAIPKIDLALVLGSGWSQGADQLGKLIGSIGLAEIPGFTKPVVAGHGGEMKLLRTPGEKIAAVLTGRTHYYEGRGVAPVVHGVRTMGTWGAKTLILTNGCGGLVKDWVPGTVVLIRDHINLTADTPLSGAVFIDMTEAYASRLRVLAHQIDPSLPEGVYVQFRGPSYETPAEVEFAKRIGGDLVGMSTTLETIAAREMGLEVLGLSLVTNYAAGISPTSLSHEEVIAAGNAAAPRLSALLSNILEQL